MRDLTSLEPGLHECTGFTLKGTDFFFPFLWEPL